MAPIGGFPNMSIIPQRAFFVKTVFQIRTATERIFQTFFQKGIAILRDLWYNIMRLRGYFPLISLHTEVYRSGHNGLDSKSSGE